MRGGGVTSVESWVWVWFPVSGVPFPSSHPFFVGFTVVAGPAYCLPVGGVIGSAFCVGYSVVGLCCFSGAVGPFDLAAPFVAVHDLFAYGGWE